ncbi:unnamed protein product [Calypogeia fissa]
MNDRRNACWNECPLSAVRLNPDGPEPEARKPNRAIQPEAQGEASGGQTMSRRGQTRGQPGARRQNNKGRRDRERKEGESSPEVRADRHGGRAIIGCSSVLWEGGREFESEGQQFCCGVFGI